MQLKILPLLATAGLAAAQVAPVWTRAFDGPAAGSDQARQLALDGAGGAYLAGSMATDDGQDICLLRVNAAGDTLWRRLWDGGGSQDWAVDLRADAAGATVAGQAFLPGSVFDGVVLRWSAEGELLWEARVPDFGTGDNGRATRPLAVDATGRCWLTGTSLGRLATACFDAGGDTLWVDRWAGPNDLSDTGVAVAVDGAGQATVVGASWDASIDIVAIRYAPTGERAWTVRVDGPAGGTDHPCAILPDGDGGVYACGSVSVDGASDTDWLVTRIDAAGDTLWTRRHDGPTSLGDVAVALARTPAGDLLVGGEVYGGSPGQGGSGIDFRVVAYSRDGDELWQADWNGDGNDDDLLRALAVDPAGDAIAVGRTMGAESWRDFGAIKLGPTGGLVWETSFDAGGGDDALALAVVGVDSLFVLGGDQSDLVLVRYGPDTNAVGPPEASGRPATLRLLAVRPNPFNGAAWIEWEQAGPASVRLEVFDLLGRPVALLVDDRLPAGRHAALFDGARRPAGLYLARLSGHGGRSTARLLLLN